jgi:OHCU decarboxylase
LQKFQIYKNLAWLNTLPADEVESVFRDCCGSSEWARRLTASRPFPLLETLFEAADRIWLSLANADWLEAFASHPKIGSTGAAAGQQERSADWSGDEQAGVAAAETGVRDDLAEVNRLYEERFGFIFIVCATGKTGGEMLAICRARLGNSAETEICLAAEEQRKITAIRLNKLLEK